jgi:hypothetical protein
MKLLYSIITVATLLFSSCGGGEVVEDNGDGNATDGQVNTENEQIDFIQIKDAKLEAAIRANLKKPEGPITKVEVLTCESLVLTSHRFEGIYGIVDISPLSYFHNLKQLTFMNNLVNDLTPLKGLIGLTNLNLPNNQVVDVSPLEGMVNLTHLWIGGNKITNVEPLISLTGLLDLRLSGNPIPKDQIEMLKKSLPNCKITF